MFANLSLECRALKNVTEQNSETRSEAGAGHIYCSDIFAECPAGPPGAVAEPNGLSLSPGLRT
ncbi:putative transposase (partial), partial [Erwinia amylovora ATCC 49946]